MERSENTEGGTADMNTDGKLDESVVLSTPTNKGATEAPAEPVEERGSAERNAGKSASDRTQGRNKPRSRGLFGVREAARKDSQLKFTALLHHVSEESLFESFYALKKNVAVGVDNVTWTWTRMQRVLAKYLPRPQILHPYPNSRFRARLEARAV